VASDKNPESDENMLVKNESIRIVEIIEQKRRHDICEVIIHPIEA